MTVFHSGHLFHLPKLSGAAKRRSATFLKAPKPKNHHAASHATLLRRLESHALAREGPHGLLSASSGLRRNSLPWPRPVCALGRPLLSSPITFLLCLGPDIPGSSSTAVIRPPFRALFDPNMIQSQVKWIWRLKIPIFTSVISGSPPITSEKLIGSENYLSWSASLELWFIGQGYEDHLVTPEMLYLMLTSAMEEDQYTIMQYLESVRDQILASPSVPSLDDVFARLLRLSSTQTCRLMCSYCNKLGHTRDRCYRLHGRPPRTAHIAQSSDPLLFQPNSAASSTSQSITLTSSDYDVYLQYQATTSASVASVAQTGNVSVCFTQSPSLGPWILDSGASDHISGNKHLFSFITTTSALPTVTLVNGSQTMAKGTGVWGRRLAEARLGHPSLSKFQKMVPRFFHFVVAWRDKLSAKATKCIFLGYSRLQKGYRCYSPDTHRYFLSANVTFLEDSPFFLSFESLPISKVLSLPYISPFSDAFSRPLQVYHRRHRAVAPPLSSAEAPDDLSPVPPISPTPTLPSTDHLPIALWKGNRSTRNPHPIYNF
ncbi:hypothetical protein CK203_108380 [Vitis vinifera]|uniref:Retrovirus-related Pol polyprotein from transposon RE2 n=1 Tax=Vitis vinifera TaxID=29760 RepID=A0A438CU77_VITVI|nr:hypothetical protein CK203_108380 [Vitis vinifera]